MVCFASRATLRTCLQWTLCLVFFGLSAVAVQAGEKDQIASAVQRGNFAYVYNAKGSQLFVIGAGDGIVGFTQSTVSIRRGNFVYIYNNKGSQTSVIPTGS
jgi:hypothetical protein